MLEFRPPEDLIRAYMERPSPGQIAGQGVNNALQMYAQMKQQEQQRAMQTQQFALLQQREAREGMNDFVDRGNEMGLPYDIRSQIGQPAQGPMTEGGVAPQVSPLIQKYNNFLTQNPQGLKGAERGRNAELQDADIDQKKAMAEWYRRKETGVSGNTEKPPRAPTGYRWTDDGNQEAVPGGPADFKQKAIQAKEQGLVNSAITNADLVISKVDQALSGVSGWTAGVGGSVLGAIPGTPARNLDKDIDTIKANLGFSALQEMRRNSPTGGALGQVAIQELEMLQATVASLDSSQSPEQVKRNLGEVKNHYENWKKTLQGQDPQQASGQSQGETIRTTRDGRKAVFDSATKQFIRYADE